MPSFCFKDFLHVCLARSPPVLNVKLSFFFSRASVCEFCLLQWNCQVFFFFFLNRIRDDEFISPLMHAGLDWTVDLIFLRLMHIIIGNWDTVALALSVGGRKKKLSRSCINFRAHKSHLDFRFYRHYSYCQLLVFTSCESHASKLEQRELQCLVSICHLSWGRTGTKEAGRTHRWVRTRCRWQISEQLGRREILMTLFSEQKKSFLIFHS